MDGVGNSTFTYVNPEYACIVEILVRDSAWSSTYDSNEVIPNGAGEHHHPAVSRSLYCGEVEEMAGE